MGVYLQQIRNPFLKILIDDADTVIGRKTMTELETFKYLSRSHATIYKTNNGELYVKDHGSYNGTYVNNKRLGKFLYPLKLGDTVGFGVPHSFKSEGLICVLLKDIVTSKNMRLLENASSKEIIFNNEPKTEFDYVKNNFSGLAPKYDTNGEKIRLREMESLTKITQPLKFTWQQRNSNDETENKPTTSYKTEPTESETDIDFVKNSIPDIVRFPVKSALRTISSEFNPSEKESLTSEGQPLPKIMSPSKYKSQKTNAKDEVENESTTLYKMRQTEEETNFDFLKSYFPDIVSVRVQSSMYTISFDCNTSEKESLSSVGQPSPKSMSSSTFSLEQINTKDVGGDKPVTSPPIGQTGSDFHFNKYFPDLSSECKTNEKESRSSDVQPPPKTMSSIFSLEQINTKDVHGNEPATSSRIGQTRSDFHFNKYFPDISSECKTNEKETLLSDGVPQMKMMSHSENSMQRINTKDAGGNKPVTSPPIGQTGSENDFHFNKYFPDLSSECNTNEKEPLSSCVQLPPKTMSSKHACLSEDQSSSDPCGNAAFQPISQTLNYSIKEETPFVDIRPEPPKKRSSTVKIRPDSFSSRGGFLVENLETNTTSIKKSNKNNKPVSNKTCLKRRRLGKHESISSVVSSVKSIEKPVPMAPDKENTTKKYNFNSINSTDVPVKLTTSAVKRIREKFSNHGHFPLDFETYCPGIKKYEDKNIPVFNKTNPKRRRLNEHGILLPNQGYTNGSVSSVSSVKSIEKPVPTAPDKKKKLNSIKSTDVPVKLTTSTVQRRREKFSNRDLSPVDLGTYSSGIRKFNKNTPVFNKTYLKTSRWDEHGLVSSVSSVKSIQMPNLVVAKKQDTSKTHHLMSINSTDAFIKPKSKVKIRPDSFSNRNRFLVDLETHYSGSKNLNKKNIPAFNKSHPKRYN